jgi:hypothetical protein
MLQPVKGGDGTPCADTGGGEDVKSLVAAVAALTSMVDVLRADVRTLSDRVALPAITLSVKTIRAAVSSHFGVTESELMVCRGRSSRAFLARRVACYMACRLTKTSAVTIAPVLGYGDHSGVLFSQRAIEKKRLQDSTFDEEMTRLESALSKPVPTKIASNPCPASSLPSPASPAQAKARPRSTS